MSEQLTSDPEIHRQTPEGDSCPGCGKDSLERDAVDIGVGTQYGPWHCLECGWSEPQVCEIHGVQLPCDDCAESDAEELAL